MHPEIQRRFDDGERQRHALQQEMLALSDAQLIWAAGADVWSIRQIFEHLVLSAEIVGRAELVDITASEALLFRVLPRAVRRALILRALRRNVVLPLPSPEAAPSGKVPLPDLIDRWDAARRELRQALETMPWEARRFWHPVAGPLTAAQMLELGETHTAYHIRQIAARRREAGFPGEGAG
jgi:hypothetical protein